MGMNPKAQALRNLLSESRNGADRFIRYSPLFPRFIVTDGAKYVADLVGGYWLFDLLASEVEPKLRAAIAGGAAAQGVVHLDVDANGRCAVIVSVADDAPPFWTKLISVTDFPEGEWDLFLLGVGDWDDATEQPSKIVCCLLSEN